MTKTNIDPTKFWTMSVVFGSFCLMMFNSNYDVLINWLVNSAQKWKGQPFKMREDELVIDKNQDWYKGGGFRKFFGIILFTVVKNLISFFSKVTWEDFSFEQTGGGTLGNMINAGLNGNAGNDESRITGGSDALPKLKIDTRSVTVINTMLIIAWLMYYVVFILGSSLMTYYNTQFGINKDDVGKFIGNMIGVPFVVVMGFMVLGYVFKNMLDDDGGLSRGKSFAVFIFLIVSFLFNIFINGKGKDAHLKRTKVSGSTVGTWLNVLGGISLAMAFGIFMYVRSNGGGFVGISRFIVIGCLIGAIVLFMTAHMFSDSFGGSDEKLDFALSEILSAVGGLVGMFITIFGVILLSYASFRISRQLGEVKYSVFNLLPLVIAIALFMSASWNAQFISKTVFGVDSEGLSKMVETAKKGVESSEESEDIAEKKDLDKDAEEHGTESADARMAEDDARMAELYGTKDIMKTVLMIAITYLFFFILINKAPKMFQNSFVYRYLVMGLLLVLCYFLAFSTLFYHVGTYKCGDKVEIEKKGIEGKDGFKIGGVSDYYKYMKKVILPEGAFLDPQTG